MTLGICLACVVLNAARSGVRPRGSARSSALGIGLVLAGRYALALAGPPGARDRPLPFLDDAAWLAIVVRMCVGGRAPGRVVRNALALPGIGLADRVFGLAFGVLEGAAGLGLALLA